MELEYDLLWFEDDDRYVKPHIKRLENHLKEFGLVLSNDVQGNADNLETILKTKEFDLILVDLNLAASKTGKLLGDKLIQKIRDEGVYTDIIFYSRIPGFREKKYELEGIYFSETEDDKFFQRLKQIVDGTLNRSLRISVTRGIFIATTIELVEQIEDIIVKILKLKDDERAFFQDSVVQAEFFDDKSKYDIIKDFLRNEIEQLDAKKVGKSGQELTDLETQKSEIEGIKDTFNKFQKDVLQVRNQLAHSKCVQGAKNTLKIRDKEKRKYQNKVYDMAECKDIREKFAIQAENLKKINLLVDSHS